jgi:hypothetical protein
MLRLNQDLRVQNPTFFKKPNTWRTKMPHSKKEKVRTWVPIDLGEPSKGNQQN